MKKFMQVLLASFGVLAIMLSGCQATEEDTSVDTEDAVVEDEAVLDEAMDDEAMDEESVDEDAMEEDDMEE